MSTIPCVFVGRDLIIFKAPLNLVIFDFVYHIYVRFNHKIISLHYASVNIYAYNVKAFSDFFAFRACLWPTR